MGMVRFWSIVMRFLHCDIIDCFVIEDQCFACRDGRADGAATLYTATAVLGGGIVEVEYPPLLAPQGSRGVLLAVCVSS